VRHIRDTGAFPAGDLHVEFGALGDERLSVADGLALCLSALGVAKEVIPASTTARANLLRSITAQRPVLIVLDDVTDSSQVLPFLPNSQLSAVLAISSARLSELVLDGADVIELDPLDGDAGAHMLRELVGARVDAQSDAVAELVRQCAGLPVALKVAAARLRARPELSIDSLAAEIAENDRGLGVFSAHGQAKVAAVFSAAYSALGEEPARLYRLFGGVAPGQDLRMDDAAVLADMTTDVVRQAVDSLEEAGLLSVSVAGRLSLHPIVRRHAAHMADIHDPASEQSAALYRLLRFRLVKAAFADRAVLGPDRYRCTPDELTKGRTSPFDGEDAKNSAVAWLTTERANLLATQRAAAEHGWHEESWQLAEALTALYVTRRYLVDWTTSSELGAVSARLAGHPRAEARLRSFMSRAWTDRGELGRAEEELIDQALPMAEASGDIRLLASVWELIGRLRDEIAPEHAAEAYERAIDLFASKKDARGVAFATFFLGCSHHRRKRFDQADAILRRSLPRIRAVPDARMEGRCLAEIGSVSWQAGRSEQARRALDEAIEVLRRGDEPFYEARAQETLLEVVEANSDRPSLRSVLSRLVDLHRAIGSGREGEFRARRDQLPPE
jgi:tetratricopeptide (TPR) repeat protein